MTSALPVAFYLRELSGDTDRPSGGRGLTAGGASESEAMLAEAHARGHLEGRAAAQIEHDADIAKQLALFDQKLAAERQTWAAKQGAHLGELIATAFEDIEQRVAQRVGEILKPLLHDKIRLKAIEDLSNSLSIMLTKGDYVKIAVSGPQDLLSAVEKRLGSQFAGVTFAATEGVDLTVNADETIIETRIGAWTEAIEKDSL